ncbi:MAG: MOSC domain-containing protein [Tardiphaga sp.]
MTFAPDSPLGRLLAAPIRDGVVCWIGIRPARRAEMLTPDTGLLVAGRGIDGDHYDSAHDGARQLTLIAAEDLAAIAAFLGCAAVPPALLRRNIVTSGINFAALKGHRVRIGAAVIEPSGDCAPCSRMEQVLGQGGYNAVRGRGGITARIIKGGDVRLGDAIIRV